MNNIRIEATEMVETYLDNLESVGDDVGLSEKGWLLLSEYFGEVPEEDRASVFNDFLKELTQRDIEYDVSEFGS